MAICIDKVNVISCLRDWDGSKLSDIFLNPEKITIIGTVADEGKLYLIYSYDDKDFQQ